MISIPRWRILRASLGPHRTPVEIATLLLKFNPSHTLPIDIKGIIESLNLRIVSEIGVGYAGAVEREGAETILKIRGTDTTERQRFVLAHQLGHVMLHDLSEAFYDFTPLGGAGPQETEANRFAAALLMPLSILGAMVRSKRWPDDDLARAFGVPVAMMRIQLSSLAGNAVPW